jgi:hypothetical protein
MTSAGAPAAVGVYVMTKRKLAATVCDALFSSSAAAASCCCFLLLLLLHSAAAAAAAASIALATQQAIQFYKHYKKAVITIH